LSASGPLSTGVRRKEGSATDVYAMRARYRRIMRFAARYLVQSWWYELFLPRIGLARLAARGRAARLQRIAKRFHVLAVDLGGLMIKVGQFMSSRLDVLPPEITRELQGLQDEVPPVPFAAIRQLAEAELGVPLEQTFAFVDPTPLAAASLGQAHRARLAEADAADTGLADVVVKIQRPGIDQVIDVDLAALRRVGQWLNRVKAVADRVDMPALVEEFATTSFEEVDYLHEAASAERFAASFAGDSRVAVPEVVWERTTRRVLTLQDVTAIKINDLEGLRAAGIDPSEVAAQFAAVMFDQLFAHGFFHADPHPGNIFVTPLSESSGDGTKRAWRFTFIDFGMMGEVPDNLRGGLRKAIIAAASRDGRGLVAAIQDVGALLPSADSAELERALTAVFARFGGMGFAELQEVDPREFRAFAAEFGDLLRSLPFQLPENFLLIIRAMSLTSGMCSALDPAFNIWDAVEPYANRLIREETGNVVQGFAQEAVSVAGLMVRLPRRVDDVITRIEEGRLTAQVPKLERRMRALERLGRRVLAAVLFAALLLGGILLRPDEAVFGSVLMAVSVLPLLYVLFSGFVGRHGPD
jgi:predicted unusual protein kinase regulating ubiquinone biosynthesis (AarF/ABC1/UbiB family)